LITELKCYANQWGVKMKEIKELLIEHRCADIGFENRGEEIEAKILSRFSELSETVKELEEGNRSLFQEKGLIKIDNDFNKTYLESAELLIAVLEKKVKKLGNEAEYERLRLAACGVAALQNTDETVKERITFENEYFSGSYQQVCDAVDREIKLITENASLKKQVEAGDRAVELVEKIRTINREYGNVGVMGLRIAIDDLFKTYYKPDVEEGEMSKGNLTEMTIRRGVTDKG